MECNWALNRGEVQISHVGRSAPSVNSCRQPLVGSLGDQNPRPAKLCHATRGQICNLHVVVKVAPMTCVCTHRWSCTCSSKRFADKLHRGIWSQLTYLFVCFSFIYLFIYSPCILSYDTSIAPSKARSSLSAIQRFLFQFRVYFHFLMVIQ